MGLARGRVLLWLISLGIAALVGVLVALLSDLPPGLVVLIAAFARTPDAKSTGVEKV